MALQSFTVSIGALTDANNNGKNYVSGEAIYVKTIGGSFAPIFRDLAGTSEIAQYGLANQTNEKGQFTFFVEAGDYILEYQSQSTPVTIVGADYFNNRVEETVNQIIIDTATSRGFRVVGDFASGFTYELPNDVAIDGSGNYWAYSDVNALPVTVPAGTIPTEGEYSQRTWNSASAVLTNTGDTVQSFVDSFALKIFQSPTDAGLTEIQTRTVDAGEVYEVRNTSDNSLATIYSDAAGTTEIVQNGTANVSGNDGVVEFYISSGEYYIEASGMPISYFETLNYNNASNVINIKDLLSSETYDDKFYNVAGFHDSISGGGGTFIYSSELPKSNHDGITTIDPDAPLPSDFNNDSQLTAWFNTSNTGTGCFVRLIEGKEITASMAGFNTAYHSRVFLQEIISKHTSYKKISFSDVGNYNFSSPSGTSRLVTVDGVNNLVIDIKEGVNFFITADCTNYYYDGFRFDNSTGVFITGKGSIEVALEGYPTTRKECQSVLFIDCNNCDVKGISLRNTYAVNSDPSMLSAFNVRFIRGSNNHTEKLTFKKGNRGKSVQFGDVLTGSASMSIYEGLGGLTPSYRDRAVRVLGASRNIKIFDNTVKIDKTASAVTVFEITSGASAAPDHYAAHVQYRDNQVVMEERDDDETIKGVRMYDFIGCKYVSGSGNTFWCPSAKDGVNDQFMAVNLKAINGVMPEYINVTNDEYESKYSYVIDPTITEDLPTVFMDNTITNEHSLSGIVINDDNRKLGTSGVGTLDYAGFIVNDNIFERGQNYTKLKDGTAVVIDRLVNFSFDNNIEAASVTDIPLPFTMFGFTVVSTCYGGALDAVGRTKAENVNNHLLVSGAFSDKFQIATKNTTLSDTTFTLNYTVWGRWY